MVERIIGKKIVDGIAWYKIKWKGYDNPEEDTWEPVESFRTLNYFFEFLV